MAEGLLAVPHHVFGRMRLVDYVPADSITPVESWEYLEREWLGEAAGFTEWLRLEAAPEILRSVAVDLAALPRPASAAMLAALALPLRPGMTTEELIAVLGAPQTTATYVSDRTTYEFCAGSPDAYDVSCTVHHVHGLIYLTMHTIPLPE
jgi:hypothetical protein